ncbi:hypothetical protein NDS46_04405 [Paenibacillus thiaminolyticus]|uniref:hypothetical protein n=1 Tax=Paenibacillus thiaminolyticus TaxID=49283 RepID=UPI00232A9513|nr:hypothetical protein [Paenibacillus thiaminolyticus]WCF09155.1 hypothetical protein NDS46_04405 [Paenibacillus thiaminolyticus]
MINVDQVIKIKSLGVEGRVEYIDQAYLYQDYMYPVQLRLNEPYCKDGHELPNAYMYRTGLKDLDIEAHI